MFPIITIIFLMFSGLLMTNMLVMIPVELIRGLHLPTWLALGAIALVFSWCFGD